MLRVHRADLTQQATHSSINTHDDRQEDSRIVAHGPQLAKDLLLLAREIFQVNLGFAGHSLIIGHGPYVREEFHCPMRVTSSALRNCGERQPALDRSS